MNKITKILLTLLLPTIAMAQTPFSIDSAKALMKANKYPQATEMLEKQIKANSDDFQSAILLGDCYLKTDKAKKAVAILEKQKDNKDFKEAEYKLLANALTTNKKNDDASAVLKEGLGKYPKSGLLYMEMGLTEMYGNKYPNAIRYWDMGISAQPEFDGNYYCEARLYASSPNKIWSTYYSEIFICITKDTLKAAEISKILYDDYAKSIAILPDSFSVNMIAKANINMPTTNEKIKLPYSEVFQKLMYYAVEPSFMNKEQMNFETVAKIRTNFMKKLFETGMDKEYPSMIFNWYKDLSKKKYEDCYNHWLIRYSNPTAFKTWTDANQDKYNEFLEFMTESPLTPSEDNRFTRMQLGAEKKTK